MKRRDDRSADSDHSIDSKDSPKAHSGQTLRTQAEEIASRKAALLPENSKAASSEEMQQTLHELRVHQIELEMQNEELRREQVGLDAARARYFDLYDLALVGYCSVSEKGLILEANLTAATLLGVTRNALVKQPITRFILKDDQDVYYRHRKLLFETGEPQSCELRMLKQDGTAFWCHLAATVAQDADGASLCGIVMSDITERKRIEERLKKSQRLLTETERVGKVGGWEFNIDTGKLIWTEGVYAVYEVDLAYNPTVDKVILFYTPPSRHIIEQAMQRSLETGWSLDVELEMVTAKGNLRSIHAVARTDPEHRRIYGFYQDITERKQIEEKLKKSQQLLTEAERVGKVGGWEFNIDTGKLIWTEGVYAIYEVDLPYNPTLDKEILFYTPASRHILEQAMQRPLETGGSLDVELEIVTAKGNLRSVHAIGRADLEHRRFYGFYQDITDRKRMEDREHLARKVLELLNHSEDSKDIVCEILQLLKKDTGFDAVGIRLRKGDDFPYYKTDGFSEDFLKAESTLCARDEEGKIIHDEKGSPVLECMCGNILCGRTDPALPFFTEGGSFWSNGTTELLALTTEADRQARTRNCCNGEGYKSVALIPLRAGEEIIGLLQLNDRRENRFTPAMISFFEGLGASIGIALTRRQEEDELRSSEERFRVIFESSPIGKTLNAPDGRILQTNKALADMVGYTIEEILQLNFAQITHPDDMEETQKYIRILLADNQSNLCRFEKRYTHKSGNDIWVDISTTLFRDAQGRPRYYISSIQDITKRKQSENQLNDTLESLKKAVNTTIQVMVSAVETRDPYTAGHQRRTADLGRAIASEMGLPKEQIDGIRLIGTIHDIGKLSIPAEILAKPTKLSELEFSLIKEHARQGYEILKDVESPWPLAEIVYQHHERMDGSGYPRNLKGNEILLEARILSVADVVEAMSSHRPYRAGLGIDAALEEIEKNRGILYDDAVAEACLRLFREKGFQLQ